MKRVQEDYFKTFSRSYEVYNFSDMNNLLHSHCQNFIVEQKLNKGMKDFFEKKSEIFEEEEIEKKKEYLSSMNLMESQFQENVFDVVIKYYNDKTKIEKSTFFKVLSEDNIYYNCNYRFLLIKNILFLMSNFQYEASYRDCCMWSLFRLLQYDTSMTQKACLELLEKKKKLLNFDYFMQNFTIHIMSIFIKSLNPSVIMVRHDYFLTLMIVKILKYFCEEHNQDFQRIFFIKEEEDGIVLHYNPKKYYINL